MYLRSGDDGQSRSDRMRITPFTADAGRTRSERVRQIRQNIADDVYSSVDVVDEIARRILRSRDV